MKNKLYIKKLGDWFREFCIVETEDDAVNSDEDFRIFFIKLSHVYNNML